MGFGQLRQARLVTAGWCSRLLLLLPLRLTLLPCCCCLGACSVSNPSQQPSKALVVAMLQRQAEVLGGQLVHR